MDGRVKPGHDCGWASVRTRGYSGLMFAALITLTHLA
jgi:hypothetical protein